MIKHILFDTDGVLNHSEMFSMSLEKKYGIAQEKVKPFFQGIFQGTLVGEDDLKEIIASHLKDWGYPGTVDEYLDEWFAFEHKVDKAIVDYVQKLRAQGIGCYIATNQEKYRAQYMIDKMGFKDDFDKLYASAHLGAKKPDLAFFQKVIDDLGAQKDEVLFWDDTQDNVDAANEFGIHGEFYESFEKFKAIMKDKYEISV